MLYTCKDPENLGILLLGPTGISAVNIDGTTIHTDLWNKPETKLLGLNDKYKAALRNRLSEIIFLTIDEVLMASSDLWTIIDSRLGEIFMMISEKAFAVLSVIAVADLLKLLPVKGKVIFSIW